MKTTKNDNGRAESGARKAERIAVNFLSYKSRTEKEVRDKLNSYDEFSEKDIELVIDFLKELGYVDDSKYAENFVRSKVANKLDGPRKIKRSLVMRGIPADAAEDALRSYAEDEALCDRNEVENAVSLARKRLSGKPCDAAAKRRVYNYLLRKGYSPHAVNAALKQVFDELCSDTDAQIDIEWE